MKKNAVLAVSLALALVLAGVLGFSVSNAMASPENQPQPGPAVKFDIAAEGLWVSGSGKVAVAPNIATLRLGVEALEDTVTEAQSVAAEAMQNVIAALLENGVAEDDIQTQYFSIYQVTKWDEKTQQQIVIGYRVTNKATAKIWDMDKVDVIIDAAAAASGDLTRIDGVSFSVDDPTPYREQARERAMADAQAKAEQLAAGFGVTLGKPTYISDGSVSVPYWPAITGMALESAETPIMPGTEEISITVDVHYAIR